MNSALAAADITQTALSGTPDVTLWNLFWQAHMVVKLVMLGLVAASVWCWAIIFDKTFLYGRSRRAMNRCSSMKLRMPFVPARARTVSSSGIYR